MHPVEQRSVTGKGGSKKLDREDFEDAVVANHPQLGQKHCLSRFFTHLFNSWTYPEYAGKTTENVEMDDT